jgi:hypothetical protein
MEVIIFDLIFFILDSVMASEFKFKEEKDFVLWNENYRKFMGSKIRDLKYLIFNPSSF